MPAPPRASPAPSRAGCNGGGRSRPLTGKHIRPSYQGGGWAGGGESTTRGLRGRVRGAVAVVGCVAGPAKGLGLFEWRAWVHGSGAGIRKDL